MTMNVTYDEVVWFSKAGFLRRESFDEALLAARSVAEG